VRLLRVAAPLFVLAVVLAACSSGTGTGGSTPIPSAQPSLSAPQPSPSAPQPSPSALLPSPSATGTAVNLGDSSLGKILVDGTGLTLYAFTADSADKSACAGDCATTWPPLTSDAAPTLGTGLDAEDFKTIARDDGSTQVTFYGLPLYHFSGDTGPGDTNGQGLGGKWYVVDAEGKLIK
jgi:predicted lipoprotein with Yx(FWY)xxD motif